jgi:NADH-quinone oxidoreductase subunit F
MALLASQLKYSAPAVSAVTECSTSTPYAASRHAQIDALRHQGLQQLYPQKPRISVTTSTCGRAAGGRDVARRLREKASQTELSVVDVGCRGFCFAEPLVEVTLPGQPRLIYGNVSVEQVVPLLEGLRQGALPEQGLLGCMYRDTHSLQGRSWQLVASAPNDWKHIGWQDSADDAGLMDGSLAADDLYAQPWMGAQKRVVLGECGLINPVSLPEYLAVGGYSALQRVLKQNDPNAVIDMVAAAGLRGRGGAGFPTAQKWKAVAEADQDTRYFIVNADEGDPGAYMDRGLLESTPFKVLEGLAIAAFATGVKQAFIFIRTEYQQAIAVLHQAINAAIRANLLGADILGADFSLQVEVVTSAGAYVCGEATSMVAVMENRGFQPRKKPPHLTECGLWGRPTCVNNVETLANVPHIIAQGASVWRESGTQSSAGTKIFSLVGATPRNGLIEVGLGTKLGVILETIGGTSTATAVQIGGPSGIILPATLSEQPLDFDSLSALDGIMGSGGLVVLDSSQCVIDTVRYFTHFSASESCGRCRACRDGLAEAAAILDTISAGQGSEEELERLEGLCRILPKQSFCGLGRSAMRPVYSALRWFREDFARHLQGHCSALVCNDLIHMEILTEFCHGERCCLTTCPGNAIQGPFGKPGHIIESRCVKCRMCATYCPYGAVRVYS